MKTGADFEQAAHAPPVTNLAGGRRCDSGQDFQKSALAGAVPAHDTDHFALRNFQIDATERPEMIRGCCSIIGWRGLNSGFWRGRIAAPNFPEPAAGLLAK